TYYYHQYLILHSFPRRRSSDLYVDRIPSVDAALVIRKQRRMIAASVEIVMGDLTVAATPLLDNGASSMQNVSGPDQRLATLQMRSEEHTSELQSRRDLVCRLLL